MKYSVVVPIHNDGYLAYECARQIYLFFVKYLNVKNIEEQVELIFVNDGSKNNSLDDLVKLKKEFNFIRIINLSRNFGQHQALACGFEQARGNLIIRLNVDMQDNPDDLALLLNHMQSTNSEIVIGKYIQRKSPVINKITSWLYFKLFKVLADINIDSMTSPMRVMSRKYIDSYNRLPESNRFPQGLDHWLGFKQSYVPVEHRKRVDNKSAYNIFSRLKLAINGLLYFSDKPIKLIVLFGFICSLLSFFWLLIILFLKLFSIITLPGYVSLMSLMLFGLSFQVLMIGVVGLYVGKIFTEVKRRPIYIIDNEC
jgi:dolichol-phosphate mannosyltransferase